MTTDLDELYDELEGYAKAEKPKSRSPKEERIIAGFEEIQRFVEEHGHLPQPGQDRDIFERIYATRLDQIRNQPECREILAVLDHQGLLQGDTEAEAPIEDISDDELLAELGGSVGREDDIRQLKHVKSRAEVHAAEEIADRTPCEDFERFKPIFEAVHKELKEGVRETRKFELKSEIEVGRFFVVGGLIAYVAEKGETYSNEQGRTDARLRVVFDNGTESNMLMRSLQRSLHKDGDAGRRITDPIAGPLFSGIAEQEDLASGTIYVLRSKSSHPLVKQHGEVLHKIGVTGGSVEKRIANAALDPTFLLADVEIVATYILYNIKRTKLENLIHKFFEPARLEIQIPDRFGNLVTPREWFLVPLYAIDEAVNRIKEGTLADYCYDPLRAELHYRIQASASSILQKE
nr:GIY-YIG nuclease family protein [uncultured Cohaesibacter sp.]